MPDVWFGDTLCRNLPPLRESHPIRQCSMLQYIDQEINDFAYMHNWCSVAVENVKRDTVQKMRSICRTRRKPYVSIVRIVSQIDELESSESEDGSTSDFSKIELPACLNSHLVCDTLQLESDDCESLADEPPSCLKELKFIDGICVQDDCARQSFKLLSLDREMSLEALSSIASSEGVSPCRSANRKFEEDETSATTYGSVIEYDVSADRNNAPECFGSGSFLVRGLQRFIQTILRNGNKQENQLLREAKENSIAHLSPIRVHIAAAGNEV